MFIFTQLILPTSEINKFIFLRSSLNYINKRRKVLLVKDRECLCNIYPWRSETWYGQLKGYILIRNTEALIVYGKTNTFSKMLLITWEGYWFNILTTCGIPIIGSERYNSISGYSMFCALLLMPVTCVSILPLDRGSVAKVKRKGLRGHPCLVPLDRGEYFERTLLVITDALEEKYNNFISERNCVPKPTLFNTENKYFHSAERFFSV